MKIQWSGSGANETGADISTGKTVVKIDRKYFRPNEIDQLVGDPSKANNTLGWKAKVTFEDLVKEMVQSDLKRIKQDN